MDALGGQDYLYIVDSADNDIFTQFDTHMEFASPTREVDMHNFEVSTAEAANGGSDIAFFQIGGSDNNLFVASPTEVSLSNSQISTRAIGFGTNQANMSSTGQDTARIEEIASIEALFASGSVATVAARDLTLEGFDEVIAEALAGESPSLNQEEHDFLLTLIGNWI